MLFLHLSKPRKAETVSPAGPATPVSPRPEEAVKGGELRPAAVRARPEKGAVWSRPAPGKAALGIALLVAAAWLSGLEHEVQGLEAFQPGQTSSAVPRLVESEAEPPREPVLPVTVRLATPAQGSIPVKVARTDGFVWPASGYITSYMGAVHPLGIDIGLDPREVSPIRATAAGVVTFAGGNAYESYGYYVEIDHGAGITTLYAHLSLILVEAGRLVAPGEVLGHGGSTGNSDGKHLHFEVLHNGQRVDPLQVLPDSPASGRFLDVDCAAEALVIEAGALVRLDPADMLGSAGRITRARFEDGGLGAQVDIEGGRVVVVRTAPQLSSAVREERAYRLVLSVSEPDDPNSETDLACEVLVRTIVAPPRYFVRQAAPSSGAEGGTAGSSASQGATATATPASSSGGTAAAEPESTATPPPPPPSPTPPPVQQTPRVAPTQAPGPTATPTPRSRDKDESAPTPTPTRSR